MNTCEHHSPLMGLFGVLPGALHGPPLVFGSGVDVHARVTCCARFACKLSHTNTPSEKHPTRVWDMFLFHRHPVKDLSSYLKKRCLKTNSSKKQK